DQAIGHGSQAKALQHLLGHYPGLGLRMNAARREPDIFPHGETVEDARHLGLDADAEARDLVGVGAGNVLSPKQHAAVARRELAGEHLEERAFTGAVRPDQAPQLTLVEREIDVAHGTYAAEIHAEIDGLQKRRRHHPTPPRSVRGARAPRRGRRAGATATAPVRQASAQDLSAPAIRTRSGWCRG